MIDIQSETLLSLTDAAARLPRRRKGKKPHVATLYRWAKRGVKGHRLETIQIGGTLCTSSEAMQRLFNALGGESPTAVTSPSRKREIRKAERELEAAGI